MPGRGDLLSGAYQDSHPAVAEGSSRSPMEADGMRD
jgi:hypothetical protein